MPAKRILLADDEPYVTTTLAAKLRKAGHEVTIANDGSEAFDLATQSPPDVLVSDYQMPILSGYELAIKLRQDARTCGVPIVMITARGHHLSPEQLALTNIRLLMDKPFSAKDLLAKVDELLGIARAA